MNTRTWHFYDLQTGLFNGRRFGAPEYSDELLALNTPPGCGAKNDVLDWQSQRVNVTTGELQDYQPPAPDADHEWMHDDDQGNRVRRWVLKPDVVERRARKVSAQARIAELERKLLRALREDRLGIVPSEKDRAAGAMTLQEIEDEIAEQRAMISSADSNATP